MPHQYGKCLRVGSIQKAASYSSLTNATSDDIKDLVYNFGIVAITMDASETTFKTYKSGVYVSALSGNETTPNLAVRRLLKP